jgi:hypothetical protein
VGEINTGHLDSSVPTPPDIPGAAELQVAAGPPEHHYPVKDSSSEIVMTSLPGGGMEWRLVVHGSAEKPEPVRDDTSGDH